MTTAIDQLKVSPAKMDVWRVRAIVFDKDGVLVDTMPMIRQTWAAWAVDRGLDPQAVLDSIHMTAYELIDKFAPSANPADEIRWIDGQQSRSERSVAAFSGAAEVLAGLPVDRWAVVTSARCGSAQRHLQAAGLPLPKVLVCAEDTPRGKPDPSGYLLAAKRLGASPEDCVAVEDAPAGIRAARAAGMRVIAVATTHPTEELREADAVIDALTQLRLEVARGGLDVRTLPSASARSAPS